MDNALEIQCRQNQESRCFQATLNAPPGSPRRIESVQENAAFLVHLGPRITFKKLLDLRHQFCDKKQAGGLKLLASGQFLDLSATFSEGGISIFINLPGQHIVEMHGFSSAVQNLNSYTQHFGKINDIQC